MSEEDNIRTQVRRISANPHDAKTSVAATQNALIRLLKYVVKQEKRISALEHSRKPK